MYAPQDLTNHDASKSPAIPSSRAAPTTSGSAAVNRKSTSAASAFLVGALLVLVGCAELVDAGPFLPGNKLFFKNEAPEGESEVARASTGQSVVLECEAGGSPSPTLHWLRNGQRIHQGNGDSWTDDEAEFETPTNSIVKPSIQLSLTRSRLFVDCLTASTAGEYECVAETPTRRITKKFNVEMSHDVLPNEARTVGCLKRNVDQPARVYMWTSHRIELEGADVQLFCRVDGEPRPAVTWYDRDDSVIAEDSAQFKLLENGDLLIRKVNWKDNMGLYRCVADNQQGSDSVHIFLYPTKAK